MKKAALIIASLLVAFAGFESWSSTNSPKVALSAESAGKLVELQMQFIEGSITKNEYLKEKTEILNATK